jgi:WD40 repeat protein
LDRLLLENSADNNAADASGSGGGGVKKRSLEVGSAERERLVPLHTLSISAADVGTCAINQSGEWLAFGAKTLGQLLVWEWQSETYVLKQQGHSYDMNAVAFSPDGTVIATGADDNKVVVGGGGGVWLVCVGMFVWIGRVPPPPFCLCR